MYQTKALHVRQGRADHVDRNQFLDAVDARLRDALAAERMRRTTPSSVDPRARQLDALESRVADLRCRLRVTNAALEHRAAGDRVTQAIAALRQAVR